MSGEFLKVVQFAAGGGSMRFHLSVSDPGVVETTGPHFAVAAAGSGPLPDESAA